MADEIQFTISISNVPKLKVNDLKRELKLRGLSPQGNKVELIDRLLQAMQQNKTDDGSADSVDDLIDEDEVLNDEEIEDEVGDYKNLELEVSDKSFELENTATNTKNLKRKSNEVTRSESVESTTKAKKITLNRHLSDEIEKEITSVTNDETNGKTEEKKVIKLSELSAKERLEMRAKKFGAPASTDAKKVVRAERFGQEVVTSTGKKTITLNNAGSSIEMLKKRAERFGSTVSSQLTKVEKEEKLEQRKARFGASTVSNGSTLDTQKEKRLERFKIK